jgi:hypothetical protein
MEREQAEQENKKINWGVYKVPIQSEFFVVVVDFLPSSKSLARTK